MVLLLALAASAACGQPAIESKVDAIFAPWNKPGSPGAAVIATSRGEVLFKKGYGLANLEYAIPIAPSTVFHVASISKQFTAFAVVLLAQEGKLSLDQDIRKYLLEMPDYGRKITARHLIHHTSGIRDQWELLEMAGWRFDDVLTKANILKLLARQRELNFDPGDEYLYSNAGYSLLAEIVERVSGQPFPKFCHDRIFGPLGMTRTHIHLDHKMIVKDRAYSYFVKGPGFEHAPLNYANEGATSLFTTVEDLAKWMEYFRTRRTVGDKAIDQMTARGVLNSGKEIAYAFGLMHAEYRGLKTVGHGGADAGYRSHMAMFPEHAFAVAVLGNHPTMNTAVLAGRVAEVFLEDRMKPAAKLAMPPAVAASGSHAKKTVPHLADFAGNYYSPELDTMYSIAEAGGKLVMRQLRIEDIRLEHNGGDVFRTSGRAFFRDLEFARSSDGSVTGFRMHGFRVRSIGFRRARIQLAE